MNTFDNQKAAQVWQRVTASVQPVQNEQELLSMIADELAASAAYSRLARHFQGKENALLRHLAQQENAHAACLKGIYTLITGAKPTPLRPAETAPDSPLKALRHCYGREMRSLAQYEAHCADPEYGQIVSRLAAQEREHCHTILMIIGRMNK